MVPAAPARVAGRQRLLHGFPRGGFDCPRNIRVAIQCGSVGMRGRVSMLQRDSRPQYLRHLRQAPPFPCVEQRQARAIGADPDPPLVDRPVMPPAQEQQILQAGLTPVGPMLDVMRFLEAAGTPRKATASVTLLQRAANVRRDRARPWTHAQHRSARGWPVGGQTTRPPPLAVQHFDRSRITRHAPRSFRGNADPIEIRASGLAFFGRRRRLGMDDDLIPLCARTRLVGLVVLRVLAEARPEAGVSRRRTPPTHS